ncbi:hypothetical protein Slin15195_G025740 [Septoria linicola]|uniref:Uncharacterized protein n=1 Tax=Septoria linicola TaxID=215465 RepID=A0A9Q9AMP9_9PEZI|nr:hypothetical protein Slin14017_G024810 [Septoria linicola]USW49255.1 hypothetical protein Slin15195_G025740 [Septoria linicola]
MASMVQLRMLFVALLYTLASLVQHALAKDMDGGDLDNAASYRVTYDLAILGGQIGQEQALIYNPSFERRCNQDRDCHLALRGMPASVVEAALDRAKLPCPDKGCDTGDLVEVYSQSFARSAQDAFIRTSLLSRFYGGDGKSMPDWSDDDLNIIAELDKWLTWDDPDESKLKRHRNHWMKKIANDWFQASPTVHAGRNATAAVRGSVFLESVFGGKACAGNSYLCPVSDAQREIVKPVLAVLWGMSTNDEGEMVLHKNNPLRHAIDALKAPAVVDLKRNGTNIALQQMLKGAKNEGDKRKKARETVEKFLKEAELNRQAANDLLFEGMKYTTEVFDPQHGRIWHPNLRLDHSRVLDAGLVALGYVPLLAMDDTGFPMLGHEQTRITSDLMPITGGDWLTMTLDKTTAPNATNSINTHHRRSLQSATIAPRDPHWNVPAEGCLTHDPRSLSRRDATASTDGFLPDFRVFQVMVTEAGGALTNSMGLPMIRAVDAIDGQLATNPVIQSADATPIKGGTSSVMAIKINGAKGTSIQLGDALQFRLDRRSFGGNKISKSDDHAQFPDMTKLSPVTDASTSKVASRFKKRDPAKVFERWVFERIQGLRLNVKTNNREIGWLRQELNATDSPTVTARLNKLLGANEDAAAAGKEQITKLETFAKGVDKEFIDELWLGGRPQALHELLQSDRKVARSAEIARAKRSEFFILENFGEGAASKELADLITAFEANDDRGFSVQQLMEIRALEHLWYSGVGSGGTSSCHIQKSKAKSGKADKVRRVEDVLGHELPTIMEDEVLTSFTVGKVVEGFVDPATIPQSARSIWPSSGGVSRHSGTSISSLSSRGSGPWISGGLPVEPELISAQAGLDAVEGLEAGTGRTWSGFSGTWNSPPSGVSVESLPAEIGFGEAVAGAELPTAGAISKIPVSAIGWAAAAALVGIQIITEVLELTMPSMDCPRPEYRTEMWDEKAAAQTTLRSPCTHTDKEIWFPTATSSATMTVVFGLPEVTGGFGFNSTSGIERRESSWNSTTSWLFNNSKRDTPLKAENGSAVAADALTPSASTTNSTIFKCPSKTLPKDQYTWVMVGALPCPVPTPIECGIKWFRQHINDLPVHVRGPNYCFNGDLVGHARAVEHNCFPDFNSKHCKQEFGLDKKENDRKVEEAKTKSDLADDELDAAIKAHWEDEKRKGNERN